MIFHGVIYMKLLIEILNLKQVQYFFFRQKKVFNFTRNF